MVSNEIDESIGSYLFIRGYLSRDQNDTIYRLILLKIYFSFLELLFLSRIANKTVIKYTCIL